jgi:hypothetical protein
VWYGELPDLVPVEWNCYENIQKFFGYGDFMGMTILLMCR